MQAGAGQPTGERVAVIGGGVTGALTAARLAERGMRVMLLEKAALGNGPEATGGAHEP